MLNLFPPLRLPYFIVYSANANEWGKTRLLNQFQHTFQNKLRCALATPSSSIRFVGRTTSRLSLNRGDEIQKPTKLSLQEPRITCE